MLSGSQVAQFDRDGFVVVPGVFSPQEVAEVVAEIDVTEASVEAFLRGVDGERLSIAEAGAITFAPHLVARSPRLREFATSPWLLGVCRDLIGPDVNLYWDQAVYKKPEKPRRFPWHQDNGYILQYAPARCGDPPRRPRRPRCSRGGARERPRPTVPGAPGRGP